MIYVLLKWIRKDDLRSVTAVIVLGSLCHFLYDWSGGLSLAALFCPVNESVWEHLKLLYFPFLLVSLVSFRRSSPRPDLFFYSRFWVCVVLGILGWGVSGCCHLLLGVSSRYYINLFLQQKIKKTVKFI